MSQQGIFSIAPDSQPSQSNGNAAPSPFTAVQDGGARPSPFTSVGQPVSETPFQPAQGSDLNQGGIPEPRPEGQPPAMKAIQDNRDQVDGLTAEVPQQAVFEATQENTGGPFQMNGFPEQAQGQFTEAAPVVGTQEDSPFVAVDQPDYEAAKAGLEPQQDFAAVGQGYSAPQAQPQPEPMYQEAVQPARIATAPVPQVAATNQQTANPQQLELRAIFGVDHLLNQQQIIQRANSLPGVRNVAIVGQQEASALSNFRQAMQSMGLGDSHDLKLNSGGSDVDFLTEGETTIAVLHEGHYAPGVKETLIIVARELGRLA